MTTTILILYLLLAAGPTWTGLIPAALIFLVLRY
jgi:hypothetical protein